MKEKVLNNKKNGMLVLILNSHARTLGTTINETVQAIGY